MRLVRSNEVIEFLAQSAPRAWIKRMLKSMVCDGELAAYFTHGKIVPYLKKYAVVYQKSLIEFRGQSDFNEIVRREFGPEVADQMIGREDFDPIYDTPVIWSDDEPPHASPAGFFIFADEIDWEKGTLRADITHDHTNDYLFGHESPYLESQFHDPDFEVELSGLCFPFEIIELLQPGIELNRNGSLRSGTKAIGRPPKWDWEGALAHLMGVAQQPDGLPTGAGAQARIEQLIADWFVSTAGDSPAESQIRSRAQSIMRSIEKPKS